MDYKFTLHNTFDAIIWFKGQIQQLNETPKTRAEIEKRKQIRNELTVNPKQVYSYDDIYKFEVGKMYLFHYDPKTKHSLKYYDTYPLIIVLNIYPGGFSGLNLHYIPPEMRLKMLSNMLEKAVLDNGQIDKFDISYDGISEGGLERLRVTYNGIKNVQSYQMYKPCLKQYCMSNVRSSIKMVLPVDWGFASMLPVENFKKVKKQQVWKESMNSLDMTL